MKSIYLLYKYFIFIFVSTRVTTGDEEGNFYENLAFTESMKEKQEEEQGEEQEEQVYDIPRPTTTVVHQQDAIYINSNFDDDIQTYDTPRTKLSEEAAVEDHIECDYDVPKEFKSFFCANHGL